MVPLGKDCFKVLVTKERESVIEPREIVVRVRIRLRLDVLS